MKLEDQEKYEEKEIRFIDANELLFGITTDDKGWNNPINLTDIEED